MKRVILCLDGTWNDNRAGSTLTNVAKLHRVIASSDGNGVRQIAHYIEGIVSTGGETAQFLKGAVGVGVGDRIQKAYELLAKDYEPGDEVHLFGFSRGAFEARSLGALITLFGVAKAGGAFSFDKAWSLYRTREKERDQALLAELRAAAHYPVRIKCVGVWDTVGNIGNPFISGGPVGRQFEFHDTRLSETIDVGLHALSIDELRGPFRPTLWTLPKGQTLPAHQLVEQVWFAGTHADVGGGHRETALSDIALLWMAERTRATTGLALDTEKLASMTRPDPLGPQHSVATGWIFTLSGLFPFIRLVQQAVAAIPPLRRMLIGSWRSGKLPRSEVAVNESIHDSVLERFGARVIELRSGRSRTMTYRPRNLVPVVPARTPAVKPDTGKPRRVKVFTVHGTFAYEADWDNWDPNDDASKKSEQRSFVNRLRGHLQQRGVVLDALDHTQYNWSGGNSHDERRTAAIGLKKLIEEELSAKYAQHGKDYYDKVYIVAHSHGGTISRLAMNLWDKDQDYYDPVKDAHFDELKHDDQCQTCMRTRNGAVGRNTVRRPDGVITFGSPFVTFEKRWGGLLTARIGVWVYRLLAVLPLAGLVYYLLQDPFVGAATISGQMPAAQSSTVRTALALVTPLVLYWMLAVHGLARLRALSERRLGKGDALFRVAAALQAFKYLLLALLGLYYVAYATVGLGRVAQWLPFLKPIGDWFWFLVPLVLLWLLVVTLPSRFLAWMRRKVVALKDKLPKKYDPSEDRAVSYLSYHTPGDEAGLHLRIFGSLTWVVQTLALSAACVLAAGIVLTVLIGVEGFNHWAFQGSLLSKLGASAWKADPPELQNRFIELMNWLTYLPAAVWSKLGVTTALNLADLKNARDVVWFIPMALLAAITLLFLLLMPVVLLLIGVAYLVSMRLRASGLVFGSESFAWTMANRIGVKRRANDNTLLRLVFIAPEAWRRQEVAHCYYYKSDRVIKDVAGYMADWSRHVPSRFLPVGGWTADAARWAVVLLFVLSIFAVSVPIANYFAGKPKPAQETTPGQEPTSEPEETESDTRVCKTKAHPVVVQLPPNAKEDARKAAAWSKLRADGTANLGPEWSDLYEGSMMCDTFAGKQTCTMAVQFCKPRPIDCKDVPHVVETQFELAQAPDAEIRSDITSSVMSTLMNRWRSEVQGKFGSEWADTSFNFTALRERRPAEEGCKVEDLGAGRLRHLCRAATTPCKKPDAQQPARR